MTPDAILYISRRLSNIAYHGNITATKELIALLDEVVKPNVLKCPDDYIRIYEECCYTYKSFEELAESEKEQGVYGLTEEECRKNIGETIFQLPCGWFIQQYKKGRAIMSYKRNTMGVMEIVELIDFVLSRYNGSANVSLEEMAQRLIDESYDEGKRDALNGFVTEYCSNCETEVTMQWDVGTQGYKAYCPHCGQRLMLCDECQHNRDDNFTDDCDYCTKTDSCRYNRR